MTLGEVTRAIESRQRVRRIEAQEKASYIYILADLVGVSMARLYKNSVKYPEISEVFPSLFDSEEIQEKKQAKNNEASVVRFLQFAQTHNKKFNRG